MWERIRFSGESRKMDRRYTSLGIPADLANCKTAFFFRLPYWTLCIVAIIVTTILIPMPLKQTMKASSAPPSTLKKQEQPSEKENSCDEHRAPTRVPLLLNRHVVLIRGTYLFMWRWCGFWHENTWLIFVLEILYEGVANMYTTAALVDARIYIGSDE